MEKVKAGAIVTICFAIIFLWGVWIGNNFMKFRESLYPYSISIEQSNLSEHELRVQFDRYISTYSKSYSDVSDYEIRFLVFQNNFRLIEQHNTQFSLHGYSLRMNSFGDMTQEEFKNKYLGLLPNQGYTPKNLESFNSTSNISDTNFPNSIDWREKGVVSGVKDQKNCKAGWAFSSISTIESAYRIAGQGTEVLSEQQLIDWTDTSQYKNEGWDGGRVAPWFDYAHSQSLCTSNDYPYLGLNDNWRDWKLWNTKYFVRKFASVEPNNRQGLYSIISKQPVSVAVDASSIGWQFYAGGILKNGWSNDVNHSVTAVGYTIRFFLSWENII